MEDLFFKQGDELSQLAPADYDPDEVTELVPYDNRKRRLALWLAATTFVVVGLAVLLF